MAYELWSQDNFTKGELSPYIYARAGVNFYYNGLKTAKNVLTYPTGAAGKRFGTLYQATLTGFSNPQQFYFQTFQYLDECVYQLVFVPNNIYIYLEGILVYTVTGTGLTDSQVYNLSSTVLQNAFRITGQAIIPYDLTRSSNTPVVITSISSNMINVGSASFLLNTVLPIQFSNVSGAFITSTPQVSPGVTYFIWGNSTTSGTIYLTAYDAKFQLNPITLTSLGGTNNIAVLNTWALNPCTFKNYPQYDFNGNVMSYDNITFTPGAVMGVDVTITLNTPYPPLVAQSPSVYINGAFQGGGGTARITSVTDSSHFVVSIQKPFDSTDPIQGSLALLTEPAWSNLRGWPQVCSSYQNRSLFANTSSLPNGFWASVINDYSDFGDLTGDDDDAISWFPSSNAINYIRFIVPYRSITVHTNSGIYSSPLADIAAITPSNFTLQLQDSTPADVLQPQAIDNQIIILSGDDAHTQLWDGINNAYTSDIVSVINEQTIRTPVDEAAFADLTRAGSRYVFIINEVGTMAVYQTLISQDVSGFTPQMLEQSYGSAQFRQTATSANGRAWFVNQRQIATALSPIAITGFSLETPTNASTLTAVASNFSMTMPTAVIFTTSGTFPASITPLMVSTYYWVVGVTADTFIVYTNIEDAEALINPIAFTSAGTSSNVTPWPLTTIFTLEELTTDTYLDCSVYYNGTSTSTVVTGNLFNAQEVKMVGDGFGFGVTGVNDQVDFIAHGEPVDITTAYVGFPINTIIEPMPLAMSGTGSAKSTTLTKPKHVRTIRFMFNNTIGGTINGVPIALLPLMDAGIGNPPIPARGIFELGVLRGWDDFYNPTYTIEHNEPFNIELLGVFYSVEF